jgi:serine/threonine protein kinase
LKLTDFGLSKNNIIGQKDKFTVCGTPEYMAPEIIKKDGHGKAVDWWCLGCLIYELVYGMPPFFVKNRNHMYDKITQDEPFYPKNWSKKIRSLLPLLLEKNPEIRLANISEIKSHPWFAPIDWEALKKK